MGCIISRSMETYLRLLQPYKILFFPLMFLFLANIGLAKDLYPRTHWIMWAYHHETGYRVCFEEAKEIAASIEDWSKHFNIDPDWMTAIYTQESYFNPESTDGKGSWGLCQMQLRTAQEVSDELGLGLSISVIDLKYNTDTAIMLSCCHFSDLLDVYKADYKMATMAYNVGEKALQKHPRRGTAYYERIIHWFIDFLECKK